VEGWIYTPAVGGQPRRGGKHRVSIELFHPIDGI